MRPGNFPRLNGVTFWRRVGICGRITRRAHCLVFDPLVVLWVLAFSAGAARAGEKVQFNRDIRPILSENCFVCHGPDPKHREADLRLDDPRRRPWPRKRSSPASPRRASWSPAS